MVSTPGAADGPEAATEGAGEAATEGAGVAATEGAGEVGGVGLTAGDVEGADEASAVPAEPGAPDPGAVGVAVGGISEGRAVRPATPPLGMAWRATNPAATRSTALAPAMTRMSGRPGLGSAGRRGGRRARARDRRATADRRALLDTDPAPAAIAATPRRGGPRTTSPTWRIPSRIGLARRFRASGLRFAPTAASAHVSHRLASWSQQAEHTCIRQESQR